jgi:hypothetical protein
VRIANIRSKGAGCSSCRFRALSEKYRLAGDETERRAAQARIELLEPFSGTKRAILVRCLECGYESRRKLNWTQPSPGCVRCGHRPYDFTAPAVLYVLQHRRLPTYKVGVTNHSSTRLATHKAGDWDAIVVRNLTGEIAYEVEQATLAWWRAELGAGPFMNAEEMPQGGWTETISADAVELADLVAFIDAAISTYNGH